MRNIHSGTVGIGLVRRFRGSVRRFVVADRSMEPTLVAGQGLIGIRRRRVRPGELRCFEHPYRPDLWLVKRVDAAGGDTMIVTSDNPIEGTTDSGTFGPVSVAGSFRVVVRIPRRWM